MCGFWFCCFIFFFQFKTAQWSYWVYFLLLLFLLCGRNYTLRKTEILLAQFQRKLELCKDCCFILFTIAWVFQSHNLFLATPLTCSACPNIPCWQCLLYLQAFCTTKMHKETQGNWTIRPCGLAVFLCIKGAGFLLGKEHHPVFATHLQECIWKVSLQKLNISILAKIQLNSHYEPMAKPESLSNYRQRM